MTMSTNTGKDHNASQTHDKKNVYKNAFSGFLGTALEYYDFVIYGLAAATVFNTLFFPDVSPAMGLLASFATYAIGFAVRPLGGIILGGLGDKIGRQKILVITIMMMGIATFLIGFLPDFQSIGIWAPILLVVLRVIQGFGAGAELSSASILLVESAPTHQRGFIGSLLCMGTNTGTLLASGVWLLVTLLPHEDLISWGWRIPFFLSFFVALYGLWLRRSVQESHTFTEISKKNKKKTIRSIYTDLLKKGRKTFFLCVGLRLGEAGPSAIWQVFLVGYIATVEGATKTTGTLALVFASILGFVTIPVVGKLIDHYGRKPMYIILSAIQALFAFPGLYMINTGNQYLIFIAFFVGLSIGVLGMYATASAWMAELFGSRYRLVGITAAKEVGGLLGSGIAPMVCASLITYFGSWKAVSVYIIVLALISFICACIAPRTKGRDLVHEHDALHEKAIQAKQV